MNKERAQAGCKMLVCLEELYKAKLDVPRPLYNERKKAWRMVIRGSTWTFRVFFTADDVTIFSTGTWDKTAQNVFEYILNFRDAL